MPDARTARRLLDVLSQLEQSLRYGRQTGNAAASELETRIANLQFENQRLRNTRQQASQRLGALAERLQQQLDAEIQNNGTVTDGTASTLNALMQDTAA